MTQSLLDGTCTNCGCDIRNRLVGQRFGRLVVVAPSDRKKKSSKEIIWECACDCGNTTYVATGNLQSGTTKSCGCLAKELAEKRKKPEDASRDRIRIIYDGMKRRCYNPKNQKYRDYGGRGIVVCDEWLGNNGFQNFYDWSMNNGYGDALSIDRVDVNGNYEPSNCRWATAKQQANNTRTNVYVDYNGEHLTLTAVWEKYCTCGISYKQLQTRYRKYHWDLDDALTRPLNRSYITVDGEAHSVAEWANITGTGTGTIYYRLAKGWSAEDAIKKPVNKFEKRTV